MFVIGVAREHEGGPVTGTIVTNGNAINVLNTTTTEYINAVVPDKYLVIYGTWKANRFMMTGYRKSNRCYVMTALTDRTGKQISFKVCMPSFDIRDVYFNDMEYLKINYEFANVYEKNGVYVNRKDCILLSEVCEQPILVANSILKTELAKYAYKLYCKQQKGNKVNLGYFMTHHFYDVRKMFKLLPINIFYVWYTDICTEVIDKDLVYKQWFKYCWGIFKKESNGKPKITATDFEDNMFKEYAKQCKYSGIYSKLYTNPEDKTRYDIVQLRKILKKINEKNT